MGGREDADLCNDVSAVTVSFIHHVSFLYPNLSASAIPVSSKLRKEAEFYFSICGNGTLTKCILYERLSWWIIHTHLPVKKCLKRIVNLSPCILKTDKNQKKTKMKPCCIDQFCFLRSTFLPL